MRKRIIVTLCGSTRFYELFQLANLRETLAGKIVLTIGCDTKSDSDLDFARMTGRTIEQIKHDLNLLHLAKIDMSDEVLILDPDGYIGRSTAHEIAYAVSKNKLVRRYSLENWEEQHL